MLPSKFSVILKLSNIHARNLSFAPFFWLNRKKEIEPIGYQVEVAKANDINPTLRFLENNYFVEEPLAKSLNFTRTSFEGNFYLS